MMREERRLINPDEMPPLGRPRRQRCSSRKRSGKTGRPVDPKRLDVLFDDYLVLYGARIADKKPSLSGGGGNA